MSNNLGSNIRKYRKSKGFTQEELANLLGVTPQAVSRWESEAGLPDIGLIIPLVQILGITTDALFGYDKANQDQAITEAVLARANEMSDAVDRWDSSLKICEYLCEESAKHPTNYEIQIEFVQQVAHFSMLVDLEGFLKDQPEKYQKMYEEGIRRGIQILRYCNDNQVIDKAHYALAWIYIHSKDFDSAREHVNMLPSLSSNRIKEAINMELVFFEKGFEEMKEEIAQNSMIMFDVLSKQLHMIAENYAWFGEKEEALSICDWCVNILNAYNENAEFSRERTYYGNRKMIEYYKMVAYARRGEQQKVQEVFDQFLKELESRKDLVAEERKALTDSLDTMKAGLPQM